MPDHHHLAFLFDVDNTLLDHDRVEADLQEWLDDIVGQGAAQTYRRTHDALRDEVGHACFLAAFERCWKDSDLDPRWLGAARFLLDYPFAERLYPHALDALEHATGMGTTAIVSDGEAIMQPRKIARAGLMTAVDGRVLVFLHKQNETTAIRARVPGSCHVMVDDKRHLLDQMKRHWGNRRLVTVLVRQGHYADEQADDDLLQPDITLERIEQFVDLPREAFVQAASRE